MWSLTLLTNRISQKRVQLLKPSPKRWDAFACSLKEASLACGAAVYLCLHPLIPFHSSSQIPSQIQTIQNSQRRYLPKSFVETWSDRDKEDRNITTTRHQHSHTPLRHHITHTGRKHYKFHSCMKIFNSVFIWKNPTILGIEDFGHELQTLRKAAPLISPPKEQSSIS